MINRNFDRPFAIVLSSDYSGDAAYWIARGYGDEFIFAHYHWHLKPSMFLVLVCNSPERLRTRKPASYYCADLAELRVVIDQAHAEVAPPISWRVLTQPGSETERAVVAMLPADHFRLVNLPPWREPVPARARKRRKKARFAW